MGGYEKYYKARDIIEDIVYKDLIGPIEEKEVLIELPTQYYTMGKLYPISEAQELLDTARTVAIESEVDNYDISLALTNMRNPSSMGITFTLKNNVDNIIVICEYAIYESKNLDEIIEEEINIEKYLDDIKDDTTFWVRKKIFFKKAINIYDFKSEYITKNINLKLFFHKKYNTGETLMTIVLVNENNCRTNLEEINKKTILQPKIRIESKNDIPIFTSVMRQVNIKQDDELIEMDLLYKDYLCYAQGHGCAVNWNQDNKETRFVETSFMPKYNLLQMKATQFDKSNIFNMKKLFTENPSKIIIDLRFYMSMYGAWINNLQTEAIQLNAGKLKKRAENNIKKCTTTKIRIERAITLLEESSKTNGGAWKAFVYANEAMYLQRCQSLKKENKDIDDSKINWYPFQLAFMLQELVSIIDPTSNDRTIVDLLWFPTGGGKTEAYLGIAAFTIFYRKLIFASKGSGLSVIMRYTLRLLTIQQYERASALICACELLRTKYEICEERFTIGLWVGNELTPGSIDKAYRSLEKIKRGGELTSDEADPTQIKVCPWCGEKIKQDNYSVNKVEKKMTIICDNEECEFNSSERPLPMVLIDEEIYTSVPTFLLATVDKFAQIAMKSETGVLFGVDTENLPPDLIIQDELHLISGPLGTMTGIYEAAITRICENNGVPIKIIASTATIRNAASQIKALYGRKHSQFPPQGISIDDSFFAKKSNKSEKPARLYVGCMGVGVTFTTTLIRVYASWLFASRYLMSIEVSSKPLDDSVIDNFWTMTGYFNSLRELGGAITQVADDIQSRYKYLKDKKFAHLIPEFQGEEDYSHVEELTSRMSNDDISKIIQNYLKIPFKRDDHEDVYDFVLASNMISVGVDVGRLGTMTVAGQPKTNSEYIQATSRVGRDNPGIVFIIYNASKSRDRSHYEQFLRYHVALYRYVEATSLTPFSERARDRGLQALFVILCRYMIDDLRNNEDAGNFDSNSNEVTDIEKIIYEYVKQVDEKELENVKNEIKELEETWESEVGGQLYYKKKNKKSLIHEDTDKDKFRMMNSMRSVEPQSGVYLLGD